MSYDRPAGGRVSSRRRRRCIERNTARQTVRRTIAGTATEPTTSCARDNRATSRRSARVSLSGGAPSAPRRTERSARRELTGPWLLRDSPVSAGYARATSRTLGGCVLMARSVWRRVIRTRGCGWRSCWPRSRWRRTRGWASRWSMCCSHASSPPSLFPLSGLPASELAARSGR